MTDRPKKWFHQSQTWWTNEFIEFTYRTMIEGHLQEYDDSQAAADRNIHPAWVLKGLSQHCRSSQQVAERDRRSFKSFKSLPARWESRGPCCGPLPAVITDMQWLLLYMAATQELAVFSLSSGSEVHVVLGLRGALLYSFWQWHAINTHLMKTCCVLSERKALPLYYEITHR